MGTPDDSIWPGVSSFPDYKNSFPKWPKQNLQNLLKQLDEIGFDLLEVSKLFYTDTILSCIIVICISTVSLSARLSFTECCLPSWLVK